jgi:glutathione S-transferase/GST-like protein
MIELYHWEPVSHSARVLICLNEIGVEYQSHYVDLLDFEQFSKEFLAMNPLAQVPVLKNGTAILTESALINEYLAESFPDAGLAATDSLGWYETIIWSKYIDYNLSSSLATLGCKKYLSPLLEERDQGELQRAIESIPVAERQPGWQWAAADADDGLVGNSERKVQLVIDRMEGILANADWLIGDSYSIADIDTFAMVNSLADIASGIVNSDDAPKTMAWLERIADRPAVKAVIASGTKHEAGKVFAPGPEHSRWG